MIRSRLGRAAGMACSVAWFGVLGAGACGDAPEKGDTRAGESALLQGRAFSADSGDPLRMASVVVGDLATRSDDQGAFMLAHPSGDKRVEVRAAEHAPVSKAAPSSDGYIELMAKKYDAQKDIDAHVGGEAKAANGATFQVDGDKLVDDAGSSAKDATLSLAAPDPQKSQELGSVPGEFKGEKNGRLGNVSTESPVFVKVSSGDKDLKLKTGAKAKLTLPAHDVSHAKGTNSTLYHFDEATGRWLEAGAVTSGTDALGQPVYHAEIDRFGWFTVGTFYEGLTCVHACVVDAQGKPVASARVIASGVDLFTQASGFAGTDGCFALEVPADARLSVAAQAQQGFSAAQLVQSGNGGTLADIDSCHALEQLVISPNVSTMCPQGFSRCGGSCVDMASDRQNCGACAQPCEDICAAGMCETRMDPQPNPHQDAGALPMDSGTQVESDGGPKPVKDGGTSTQRDSGVSIADSGSAGDGDGDTSFPDSGASSGDGDGDSGFFDGGSTTKDAGPPLIN